MMVVLLILKILSGMEMADSGRRAQTVYEMPDHLGITLHNSEPGPIIAKCFRAQSESFQKSFFGDRFHHFTKDNKDLSKRLAGQMLIELGYETDVSW